MAIQNRIIGIDALRAFAAIGIAVFHTIVLLKLHNFSDLPRFIGPTLAYMSLAVPLFFAISAVSLCAGYLTRLDTIREITRFYVRRYARIAPLFYLMIAAWMARRLFYGWPLPSLEEIAINVTFLFWLIPGWHESLAAAGWSIGVEMAFYAAFPFLIAVMPDLRRSLIGFALSIVVALCAAAYFNSLGLNRMYHWMNPLSQAPFFIGGIMIYHLHQAIRQPELRKQIAVAIVAATPIIIWFSGSYGALGHKIGGWSTDRHILGLLLLPLVLAFTLCPIKPFVNRATVYLGLISYGIYLIHPWVIMVLAKPLQTAMVGLGYGGAAVSVPVIVLVLAVTCALAAVSYHVLERPCLRAINHLRLARRLDTAVRVS